eukprot:9697468-Karenia_brevis.AAC.1
MAIIPISTALDAKAVNTFKGYIRHRVGKWSTTPIVKCAKYFCFAVGPDAAGCMWDSVIEEWRETAALITDAKLTLNMAAAAYNSRACLR